jgi:hypothetical protein
MNTIINLLYFLIGCFTILILGALIFLISLIIKKYRNNVNNEENILLNI